MKDFVRNGDADLILVLDCDVPWTPSRQAPGLESKVVHIGVDPLFSRYPIRGFAADVARGLPTAVTVAAKDESVAQQIAERLATPAFRLYRSTDISGVEIGGAAKNVLAIACGIAEGAGLGASAGAALIARGFAELARFGRAFEARPETLMGLSGLGDLVLTCSSEQSRNFSYGLALGRGETPQMATHGYLVEGAFTAPVLIALAHAAGVDMPISHCVARVIAGELTIADAIEAMLQRPQKSEW